MSMAQDLMGEFEEQAPLTRKFLERLPEEKLGWKPHQKSLTAGQLALHLAQVPGSVARLVRLNPAQFPGVGGPTAQPARKGEILEAHDEGMAAVRLELLSHSDSAMQELWQLQVNGQALLTMPRGKFIRDIMLNHWYQHRGQFSVYLRMLDVAVPSTWGPSADEAPAFIQKQTA